MVKLNHVREGDYYGDLNGIHIKKVDHLIREVNECTIKRNGHWVLYGMQGEYIDDDMYRNDLAERNGFSLNHPYLEEDFGTKDKNA